jgi:hypothetical protein
LVGALCGCVLLLGCASQQPTQITSGSSAPRAGEPQSEDQSCWRDSECVLVDDCCGCARGGLRMSVRGDHLAALNDRSASECEKRSCGDRPSKHRSCSATAARCTGGRCVPSL